MPVPRVPVTRIRTRFVAHSCIISARTCTRHTRHTRRGAERRTRSRDETNRGNEIFYAPEYALYTPPYPAELTYAIAAD